MISGNLFTREYLLDGIDRTSQWKGLTDESVAEVCNRLKSIAGKFLKIAKPNEAETEKDFIYPVIEALGWSDYQVQQILSQKGRKQVPDALLFADDGAESLAVAEAQQWKRFQYGLAVLEAKRWNRALDRADKRDLSEEGVPSTQMLQYLSRVDVQTNNKVRLGILTNGSVWRLYFQGALSVSEDFLEIDLAQALALPGQLSLLDATDERLTDDRALRLFILFFGKTAFLPVNGPRTFHDLSREAGKTWEEKVAKDLSQLVFGELFPKLVAALAEHDLARPAQVDDAYLDDIRQASLILLYRLLFVVYAEDRDLLPDQREPYKSYSLTTMRFDIADRTDRKQIFSATMVTYWPKLRAVFKAIAQGDDDLGIPPYNGGLFSSDSAQLLDRVELPDSIVAALIFGLSHREEEGRSRYINYRDLSVQQLGTIYERTLEYGLKFENGKIVVSADDAARHESGSYYTPDSLVSLIIEKAVGPFIEERLAVFRERSASLAKDKRRPEIRIAELQGLDPATHILELRICDPAMGSGHFLVSLVDWLADRALAAIAESESVVDWSDAPYRSPILNSIEATRQDIIKQATKHGWPFTIEHLDDRHIVRRTILKRCIYGVDRNPMAVELAKVALWLHTFTVGAPLSFLDHHLRCGNSLLGFWLRSAMDRLTKWGGQLLINEPMKKAMAQAIAMQRLERVTDADIAEVHESKTLFDGIEQETQPLNTFIKILYALDWDKKHDKHDQAAIRAWLDGQFGDPIDIARGKLRLGKADAGAGFPGAKDAMSRLPEKIVALAERFATILSQARALVRNEGFQNWQISFPGVWKQWESTERVGGFDAVIGNPPYVRQELIKEYKPSFKRAYPATYDGSADLFVYFYEQGLNLLRPGGRLSYVVTNKWMRVGYADRLRDLFSKSAWVEFVADFGHAKRFFPDADVFPSVAVIRKPGKTEPPEQTSVCVIPRDDVPEKGLEEAVTKATYMLPRSYFGKDPWALEPPATAALLTKVKAAGTPLRSVISRLPVNGIKTGLNEAFLINADEQARLVAADPACASIIKPYMRGQDIRRWHSPDRPQFMILLKSSSDFTWPWSGKAEANAEAVFQQTYPALFERMKRFEDYVDPKTGKKRGLRRREDQGKFWWELRSCAYYDMFAQRKIIYQAIQYYARYTFETEELYGNNKTYFVDSDNLALLGILNSPLLWWYGWRHFIHMKDEALSNDQVKIAELPISADLLQDKQLKKDVSDMLTESCRIAQAEMSIREWLHQEFAVKRGATSLRKPSTLSFDEFVTAVKSGLEQKRKLTASEITELKREYTTTIWPLASLHVKVAHLETSVSDRVNAGYGLSEEDVALMWRSAPPRMPASPHGLVPDDADTTVDDDD